MNEFSVQHSANHTQGATQLVQHRLGPLGRSPELYDHSSVHTVEVMLVGTLDAPQCRQGQWAKSARGRQSALVHVWMIERD